MSASVKTTAPACPPALLSDQDLADYLGISRALVRRWASAGKLPAPIAMPGRVTRWRREQIDAIIEQWAERGNNA